MDRGPGSWLCAGPAPAVVSTWVSESVDQSSVSICLYINRLIDQCIIYVSVFLINKINEFFFKKRDGSQVLEKRVPGSRRFVISKGQRKDL